nr:reverse transcriptase domain-containing protein [Tanacetum cinerariifolium]
MDKVRHDKGKEVHDRLDFGEGSRERRTREGSHYSSARTLSARPERLKVRDRLSYNNGHVFDRLGINHKYRYYDRDCSRHMKSGRDSESSSSSVSKSDSSDGRHRKSKSKRHKPTDEDDLMMPWMCAEQKKYVKDPVEIHNIKQKDRETIEDFMERFKVETERIKRAPESKGRKRVSLTRTPKEILTAEAGKFQPPPPMVTPVEKRSSNKFCDFYNDKGHSTDEYGGSSMEVLYENCFNWLRTEVKNQMVSATTSLTGFSRETIWPLGQLRLLNKENSSGTIHSPAMLKFLADGGIVTIRSTILVPVECAMMITSSEEVAIRGTLSVKGRIELCSLLKENLDIFAWQPSDMTGVPRSVAEHRLNTREGYSLVRGRNVLGIHDYHGREKLCPDKTEAVLQLPSLRTIKEVQSLNGKLASLNRFLSKSAEKSLPLFKTLKNCIKKINFHLTSKAKQAFKQLKQHLSELPLPVALIGFFTAYI